MNEETVAFTINHELYYLKTGPDLPKLFNRDLNKLIIPNLDTWLQAQTQQRYSYRGLKDMAAAFSSGLRHSYASDDLAGICGYIFDETVKMIFTTEYAHSYAVAFKVELMDPKQISKLIEQIKGNFDSYTDRFGEERFYLYLCRLLKICNYHEPSESIVVETLIKRLGKRPREPEYQKVGDGEKVRKQVIAKMTGTGLSRFKGIDQKVLDAVNEIQAGKVS